MKGLAAAKTQSGTVLMISLLILLVMTLLGVSGINTTIMEEKMAGNFKNTNLAFQSAESGLRAAEAFIVATPTANYNDSTPGLYQATLTGAPRWEQVNWDNTTEVLAYPTALSTDLADLPDAIIEEMAPFVESGDSQEAGVIIENIYYRVTANAVGGTTTAKSRLQTTYKR